MADSLASSVMSLRSSLQLLDSSIDILDSGVHDFPRLTRVLQTTRHFELLPEPTLQEAQQALLDEITPSIAHLLSVASNHVERLARREDSLKAKCELQEGRMSDKRRVSPAPNLGRVRTETSDASAKAIQLRRLVQKKERLKYAVDRLELQSRQKERELRKSMAFQ
ncbi:mitotic spindle biogenesis protein Spc19 [Talaromyces proteolyticus]|uniref:DASH complex subunit SPC19 n=1 Tax=Talaromyces proteolyticus TaxID=1131652 RepID=A0AAD4PV61_9EURO|nr:mitotic spindle biogenesis protein Spc19 [Talaromyces proteolyticus]KAH8692984.1 mitotic spindle biogenesis protein Spc19 [Talaromyces proteolyticus]